MNPLIPFHVLAGSIALIAGAAAMSARKGGPLHAKAGTAFFLSMLAMAGTGAVIALLEPGAGHRDGRHAHLLSRRDLVDGGEAPERRGGRFEIGAMLVALACAASLPGLRADRAGAAGRAVRQPARGDPFPVRRRSPCWPPRSTSTSSSGGASPTRSASPAISGG